MSRKPPTNLAASVRQRLHNLAKARGEELQLLLTRYGIERLLYRLSSAEGGERFVLKGAVLFYVWNGEPHRPTRDVDFSAYGDPSQPHAAGLPRTAGAGLPRRDRRRGEVPGDGVPGDREYAPQGFLRCVDAPRDAGVQWRCARGGDRGNVPARNTPIPTRAPLALSDAFGLDREKQSQWARFLERGHITGAPEDFAIVVERIVEFVLPPALARSENTPFTADWTSGRGWSSASE